MKVWFLMPDGMREVEMNKVGIEALRETMRKLGLKRAEVVVWPENERDPVEVGVIEIQEVGV